MTRALRQLSRFLRLPALALLLFALFGEDLPAMVEGGAAWWEPLRNTALSGVLFLGAHLLHAISSARLTRRRKGRRPVPDGCLGFIEAADAANFYSWNHLKTHFGQIQLQPRTHIFS